MKGKCKACGCTLLQRIGGDGCAICNPAKALDYARETIEDLEAENARLLDTVQDLVATFASTPDGRLCSMAMSSLADAMRLLSEHERMTIEIDSHRLVWGRMVNQEASKRKAPWKDYAGGDIYEGDHIVHPTGQRGRVIFLPEFDDPGDQWRVDYGDGINRLCLQIGDKGMARVESREAEK